jgi:zinc protease
MMTFMAEVPKEGNLSAAREALIQVAEGIPQEPVTQEQLNRVRARDLEDFEKMMTDSRYVGMMLSEVAAEGDWRLLFWWRDEIKKVTLQDIQRVAGQYLIPSNLTVGLFIPDAKPIRAAIPETPDYAAMLKNYQGGKAMSAGEQFDATPANIEARTTRATIGPIKVAYLAKKTRGNLVTATLTIHFGNEEALMNRSEAADLAAALLMRGTTQHDMQQLRDALTAIKTQMSVSGGPTEANVMIQTDREHLAAALRLAAEVLEQPTFPEKEFEEVKRSTLADMEEGGSDPQAIATLALRRALSPPYPPGHVNYVPTLDEAIGRLKNTTLADVKKFYKDFYGVGAAEMTFVGEFDPKEVTPLLTELFVNCNWKSPTTYQRIPSLYKAITGGTESFNTPDKQNAVFLAATNLALRDDDASYPALVLGNYMLGGGFLNSRLATRIRQREGLSYGVSSRLMASSLDKAGSFSAFAICAPQNLSKVATAFQEELKRVLTDGFTAKELAEAKSGYLQSRTVALSNDGSLAGALARRLFEGRDFHWDEKYEAAVRALTVEQVNQTMRQFLDPNKLIVMSAGDLSKEVKP